MSEDTLDGLFARYVEEVLVHDRVPSLEGLCRSQPHLLPGLRRRVRRFTALDEHLSQTRRLRPGSKIGPYQVEEELGRGSMGLVYGARYREKGRREEGRREEGRPVALKVLRPERGADPSSLRRFAREAAILRRLRHPNIVTCHGLEEIDGFTVLVFERVDGLCLAQDLPPDGVGVAETLKIAHPLASALAAAHGQGIVHRDLKLANLMRAHDGTLKVLDFGLAHLPRESGASTLTRTGQAIGSVPYMAPEQLLGHSAQPASDVFAFGVVLYELLTGRRPFQGETLSETVQAIFESEPEPLGNCLPEVPPSLASLVASSLAKDASQRPTDAVVLLRELARVSLPSSRSVIPFRPR